MPKVYSFDVFDTVVTRKVGLPRHIFLLTGIRIYEDLSIDIEPQIFVNARIAAEKELIDSDVTTGDITDIYQNLARRLQIPEGMKRQMMQIELETEFENIIPIEKNVKIIQKLREAGERIVYISDMYLGEEILKELLTGLGIRKNGESIFVSCDYGADKKSGKLFDIVLNELGVQKADFHHFGNSKKSDIQGAGIAKITSTYLPDGNLNRYEKRLALSNEKFPLNAKESIRYSKIAAAARLARLSREEENKQIFDVSCSVAAPVLYSFVNYILENAKDKRIYFLARDGYILYQIARRIIQCKSMDTEVRYLYISREVLVLARFEEMAYDDYVDYIAEIFSEETLLSIIKKLKISDSAISIAGLTEKECGRKLFDINKKELNQIFTVEEIHQDIERESRQRKKRLLEYFRSEGVLDKKQIAIADSGWKLTIQNLMADLIIHHDIPKPEGYYFGINEPAYSALNKGKKHGFFWDLRKEEDSLIDPKMIRLFEVFCSAPHGQTVDYNTNGQTVEPELNELETRHLLDWGIEDMEKGILKTVDVLLEFNNEEFFSVDWWDRIVSLEPAEYFWHYPTPEDIQSWGTYPYNITNDGRNVVNLFEKKPFWSLFRYVLRRGKLPNSRLDHWPNAYLYSLQTFKRVVIKNTIQLKKSVAFLRRNYLPFNN